MQLHPLLLETPNQSLDTLLYIVRETNYVFGSRQSDQTATLVAYAAMAKLTAFYYRKQPVLHHFFPTELEEQCSE